MRGPLRALRCAALCVPLLLPGGVAAAGALGVPLAGPPHSLDYWVLHTPRCWGPVCVNVFYDHWELSLQAPLP